MSYAGVSKKIADPEERERLYVIARRISEETGMGMIARTAAEGADEETLRRDYDRTRALWREIDARARCARAPKAPGRRKTGWVGRLSVARASCLRA